MPKVSVIIPVYNVEKYIEQCLDSVINQTLSDIEIICVNDCSTDNSSVILKKYDEMDPRIIIYNNLNNMGLSYTRNIGIKHACGEYIQFVDSDDLIEPDTLELLYNCADTNNLTVVHFGMKFSDGTVIPDIWQNVQYKLINGKSIIKLMVQKNTVIWGAVLNFIKKDFLQHNISLYFDEAIYGCEDALFTFKLLKEAERCMHFSCEKYIYNKRSDSITTGYYTEKNIKGYLICIKELLRCNPYSEDNDFNIAAYSYISTLESHAINCLEQCISLDMSDWDNDIHNMYNIFLSSKRRIRSDIIFSMLSELKKSCVYLYGAGNYAGKAIELLYKWEVDISGIIVTDKAQNRERLYGYRIYSIDEEICDKETAVILCTVKNHFSEIRESLLTRGYKRIINIAKEG